MSRLKEFLKTSLLGGVAVILPVVLLVSIFLWIFEKIDSLTKPLANLVILKRLGMGDVAASIMSVSIAIMLCFAVGVVVKTKLGKIFHELIEEKILKSIPGYSLLRGAISLLTDRNKSPFSEVALADVFGTNTWRTVFVMDRNANGFVTVFEPTAPNPTTGFIYHVHESRVKSLCVPSDYAVQTVLSCGAGSSKLTGNIPTQSPAPK